MNPSHTTASACRPSRHRPRLPARLLSALCGLAIGLGCLVAMPAIAEAREVVHVVQKGQWLDLIAKRYHTTAGAILKRNNMGGNDLKPGMKLIIVETDEHRKWREHVEKATGKRVPERVREAPAPPKPAPKKAARKAAPSKAVPKKTAAPEPREIKSAKQRVAPRSTPEAPTAEAKPTTPVAKPAPETAKAPEPAEAVVAPPGVAPKETFAKEPKRPGYVTLIRYGEKFRGQLVASNGKVVAKSSERVDRLLRSLRTGKQARINRRLLARLTEVSDHFGGRTIVIVSGFRPYSPKQYTRNSRHNHGEAVDFKVMGVPTDVVFEHCRQFDGVGCGYYPNSGFIHMDVRGRNTQWTDYSQPGQPPKYAKRDKRSSVVRPATPTKTPSEGSTGHVRPTEGSSAKRHVASQK